MQGQKGANLDSTRRIWRRMARDLIEHRAIVAAKRARPGYDESTCRRAELVRSIETSLAPGSPPPVGVLKGLWAQVCDEFHARPPTFRPPRKKSDANLTSAPNVA